MDWIKVFGWVAIAVSLAGVVWRLAWLARTPASDDQSEDEDSGPDGSRRDTWSAIRWMLVPIAGAPGLLIAGSGGRVWFWLVAAFLALAVGADLVGWLRRGRVRQS